MVDAFPELVKNHQPFPLVAVIGFAAVGAIFLILLSLRVFQLSISDQSDSSSTFNWMVVIGSLLIAAISLGISFWSYYARMIYLKDGPALVPEKWGHI